MANLTRTWLDDAVASASALRVRLELQPAMSDGLVQPPTYEKGRHLYRPAWINGAERQAVLLDSVQSQANRVEEALLLAHRTGRFLYPDIEIDVDAASGHESYSVLQLSHRIYDAVLRKTWVNEELFPDTVVGKAVYAARADRASALLEHAPVVLALGGWDSHAGGGPNVAKLQRVLTSEIIGLDAKPVEHGAVKIDPMDIRKSAGPIYKGTGPNIPFVLAKPQGAKGDAKELKPSEVGLGNVPSMSDRGAVITSALQTSVISLPAIRALRFQLPNESFSEEVNHAGRLVVAALTLYGLLAQMDAGYSLRSGCDLIPREEPSVDIIGRTLRDLATEKVDVDAAGKLLSNAITRARLLGLAWRSETIKTKAHADLVRLIEQSRKDYDGA